MLLCMRTTLDLDERIYRDAKTLAVASHKSLKAVVEEALSEALARRKVRPTRREPRLTTFRGRGVQAGVDLDSRSALEDLMDAHDNTPHARASRHKRTS